MSNEQRHYDEDPIVRSGAGHGQTFDEVIGMRLSRRDFLVGSLAIGMAASCQRANGVTREIVQGSPTGLDFTPLGHTTASGPIVAPGYELDVLVRWGDPLKLGLPPFDATKFTASAQAASFGYNNDFVGYLPLPYGSQSSDHGLLGVNFEYVNPELMFPITSAKDVDRSQTEVCLEAVGFGVVEIKREGSKWSTVVDSPLNKRYTLTTPMLVSGPAAGSKRMMTSRHSTGRTCTGTMSNCAAGKTPWGTVLSGEENFQSNFANAKPTDALEIRRAERYGIPKGGSSYGWEKHFDRFDASKEPNEPNHFGWVVEIDPYDPAWTPVKRTALGRCRHEASTSHVTKRGQVVLYTGDDAKFEYVYKFVCSKPYNTENREANRGLLDEGTLYVAKFNSDGSGQWLPLVHGQGPLIESNGFRDQGDVVIDARLAGDLVGATKMDRPEDIEVNPVNEKVYIVCTNNSDRGRDVHPAPDPANPRKENKHGHIIELSEDGGDHASTTFTWDLFLVCGDPADPATHYAGYDKSKVSPISCPDNICFDAKGNLWIATDGMESSMKVPDGFFAVPTDGPERGMLKRFFASVVGSEVCGPEFTPDGTTAFLAIQHPGEDSKFLSPSTRWPDGTGVPRPSIIAIRSNKGGVIGSA